MHPQTPRPELGRIGKISQGEAVPKEGGKWWGGGVKRPLAPLLGWETLGSSEGVGGLLLYASPEEIPLLGAGRGLEVSPKEYPVPERVRGPPTGAWAGPGQTMG